MRDWMRSMAVLEVPGLGVVPIKGTVVVDRPEYPV